MNNVFLKDIKGNYWAMNKVVGFVIEPMLADDEEPTNHCLIILDGGLSAEISPVLYAELTKSLITLEAATSEG